MLDTGEKMNQAEPMRMRDDMGAYPEKDDIIFRNIVEVVNDYVFVCSYDYRILYMNPSLKEKIGRDAIGEFCYSAIHDNSSVCSFCIDNISPWKKAACWEFTSQQDNHLYDVSNMQIKDKDGAVARLTIVHDTTRRRMIEENLREEESGKGTA
jgi:hypothetical protein